MRGGDKKRACGEFLYAANFTSNASPFIPKEKLTPYAFVDLSTEEASRIITLLKSVPKEHMLILILGETINPDNKEANTVNKILNPYHKLLEQPFVQSFSGPKTVLFFEPELKETGEVPVKDKRLINSNIERVVLVKGEFPLSPVYGPHKNVYYNAIPEKFKTKIEYGQPNVFTNVRKTFRNKKVSQAGLAHGLRRFIYPNALAVLNTLVDHPGQLLLNSRITSVCYRSFKYILDMRQAFERPTLVLYEYSEDKYGYGPIKSCNTEYTLFSNTLPGPMETCSEYANLDKYYTMRGFPSVKPEHVDTAKEGILKMDKWANEELLKYIPKKPTGGRRKTRRRNI